MYRKLITACMALAAFVAFGVAATSASAAPVLTEPTGTPLAAGASITATNVGSQEFATPLGTLSCDHADMHGTVHSNSTASGIKLEITSASFSGSGTSTDCTGPGSGESTKVTVTGLPRCAEATTSKDTFVVRGGGCTSAVTDYTFTFDLTLGVSCDYSKASVSGTVTTDTSGEDAKLSVSGERVTKSSGGFLCPSEGTLRWTFTLETTDGTPIYLSS